MEKLLVIIMAIFVISIVGLKIAEVYEYEDHKKVWEEQYKKNWGQEFRFTSWKIKIIPAKRGLIQ